MRGTVWILLLTAFALGDVVSVKGSKKVQGRIVSEDDQKVVVNIYNSTLDDAVLGRVEIPRAKVKSIKRTFPAPRHEFQRKLRDAMAVRGNGGGAIDSGLDSFDEDGEDRDGAGDGEARDSERKARSAACLQVAEWCAANKLKKERVYALEMALRFDYSNAAARKQLGSSAPKRSFFDQKKLAGDYLKSETPERVWREIKTDSRFPYTRLQLDRARRSLGQAKGYQEHRPLAMRADKLEAGAKYTLFVPAGYDPLIPTPLVIGLHGGGAGGADGKLVVGSGEKAMPFYQRQCQKLGWICACPNAVRAGWGQRLNNDVIDALLDELRALYHIDEARIYLIGHSMGGGGTWAQGDRLAETWAAVAPAASFGVRGISRLQKTGTGFYVYHSDDDPRTRVGGVRPHMLNLPGSGADFVYSELKGRGHSFPGHVVDAIFEWFLPRTVSVGRGRPKPSVRPISSFARKPSRDEKKYLPDLSTGIGDEEGPSLSSLLKKLRTGGGVAKQVVAALVAHKDPKTNARTASVLLKAQTPDVRRYAARVLGGRKATAQIDTLGRVLLIESDSDALLDLLAALGEIDDAAASRDVLKFLKLRVDYLHKRAQNGRVDNSDWSTILPTLARACTLLGGWKSERAGRAIAEQVVDRVFLGNVTVIYDRQNQQPLPVGRALARAATQALVRLGDRSVVDVLQRAQKATAGNGQPDIRAVQGYVSVMGAWLRDAAIRGHVETALRDLSGS